MVICKTDFKLPEVFIISSGRSGTTLLSSILNASNQIYFPYESDFVARAHPIYQHQKSFSDRDYQNISSLFLLCSQPQGWGMSEDYILRKLQERSPQTFAEVYSVICQAFHQQEGTEELLWGIKAPVLIASLQRIHAVCPNAKIVHLVRDGRDVYLSYRKIHEQSPVKFGPKGTIQNALYWVDGLRRVEEYIKLNYSQKIYELKYGELISSPASELKDLCTYLNVDYQPSMYQNFGGRDRQLTPENLQQSIHQNINSGLVASNTQKYLTQMSRLEKIQYELVAAPYLIKYGYQLEYPWLNSFWFAPIRKLLYFLARSLNDLRYSWRDLNTYKKALNS